MSPTALRLCHSGDSRAYLVRDGVLERLTTDHNLAALYVEAGRLRAEDADHHPSSSRLTSFLGAGPP